MCNEIELISIFVKISRIKLNERESQWEEVLKYVKPQWQKPKAQK